MIQHVGFERVVYRLERFYERPQPLQIGQFRGRVLPPVHVVRGPKPLQVVVDEGRLVAQVGLLYEQLVVLGQQQAVMNFEFAKAAAPFAFELGDDQLDQARMVGPLEPRQELPLLIGIQVRVEQAFQGRVFEALQRIGKLRQSLLVEPGRGHERRIELGRQVGLLVQLVALMLELQVQPFAQQGQRSLWVLVVGEQGLTILDFDRPLGPLKALDPGLEQSVDFFPLLGVLVVQGVIVVIVLRARNQLPKRKVAIGRQRKAFDPADFAGLHRGRTDHAAKKPGQQQNLGRDGPSRDAPVHTCLDRDLAKRKPPTARWDPPPLRSGCRPYSTLPTVRGRKPQPAKKPALRGRFR